MTPPNMTPNIVQPPDWGKTFLQINALAEEWHDPKNPADWPLAYMGLMENVAHEMARFVKTEGKSGVVEMTLGVFKELHMFWEILHRFGGQPDESESGAERRVYQLLYDMHYSTFKLLKQNGYAVHPVPGGLLILGPNEKE